MSSKLNVAVSGAGSSEADKLFVSKACRDDFKGTICEVAQLLPHEIREVIDRMPKAAKDAMEYLLGQSNNNRPVPISVFTGNRTSINQALGRAFAEHGPPKYYRLVFGTDADGEQAVQLWLVDPKVRK